MGKKPDKYDEVTIKVTNLLIGGEQDDMWVNKFRPQIAAILRASFPTEASGELIDDVIETSRMIQHSFDGRTGMYWDEWVAHIQEVFPRSHPAPTAEKALREALANEAIRWCIDHGMITSSFQADDLRAALLAHEAPKEAEHE